MGCVGAKEHPGKTRRPCEEKSRSTSTNSATARLEDQEETDYRRGCGFHRISLTDEEGFDAAMIAMTNCESSTDQLTRYYGTVCAMLGLRLISHTLQYTEGLMPS